ncbi:MAG: hypothetical protein R3220_00220 [Balneolaceae bacterium]|nr:hypothetical protein [Balneolaceae bacterium]
MSKKAVRKIFIFVLIFLPLQYILVGVVGYYKEEPWPAFVFPGFKNVYETDGQFHVHQTRFELYSSKNVKIVSVRPYRIFQGVPRSQLSGLLRSSFNSQESIQGLSPEAIQFIHENGRKITGQSIRKIEVVEEIDFIKDGSESLNVDSTARRLVGTIHFSE